MCVYDRASVCVFPLCIFFIGMQKLEIYVKGSRNSHKNVIFNSFLHSRADETVNIYSIAMHMVV